MNLREEIYRYVYNHSEEQYGKCEECEYRTDIILKLFEKRIDEIQPAKGMEYHCIASVTYTKDKMKEILK
jgi:hypothetical protein